MPGDAIVLNDTTFAGDVTSFMITRAVIDADTINKGCVMVEDGIKKQRTIPRLEVSGIFQKRQATPISQGTVTIDAVTLVPRDLMLYFEFNPRDFESHWYAFQLEKKLIDETLPPTIENFMVMQTMKRVAEFFENAIWRSRIDYDLTGTALDPTTKGALATDANFFYFDGLVKKALAAGTTIQVPSPVALTPTNIRTMMQTAYQLVPPALLYKYGSGGLKFLMSYADQQKYENALLTDTFKNQDTSERGINRYSGYDIVPCAGIPQNTFFLCIAKPDIDSNLWIGMNSMDDNQLQLMKLQNNSELYFIKGLFKLDTQIGFPDQLVMYTTITA